MTRKISIYLCLLLLVSVFPQIQVQARPLDETSLTEIANTTTPSAIQVFPPIMSDGAIQPRNMTVFISPSWWFFLSEVYNNTVYIELQTWSGEVLLPANSYSILPNDSVILPITDIFTQPIAVFMVLRYMDQFFFNEAFMVHTGFFHEITSSPALHRVTGIRFGQGVGTTHNIMMQVDDISYMYVGLNASSITLPLSFTSGLNQIFHSWQSSLGVTFANSTSASTNATITNSANIPTITANTGIRRTGINLGTAAITNTNQHTRGEVVLTNGTASQNVGVNATISAPASNRVRTVTMNVNTDRFWNANNQPITPTITLPTGWNVMPNSFQHNYPNVSFQIRQTATVNQVTINPNAITQQATITTSPTYTGQTLLATRTAPSVWK